MFFFPVLFLVSDESQFDHSFERYQTIFTVVSCGSTVFLSVVKQQIYEALVILSLSM